MSLPLSPLHKHLICYSLFFALLLITPFTLVAQSDPSPSIAASGAVTASSTVPHFVRYSGSLPNAAGSTISLRFSLYAVQTGGNPIWSEVQSVTPTEQGKYSVLLGSTTSTGLPQILFTTGAAHWLSVTPQTIPQDAQSEFDSTATPRTLLLASPYALKASDSDTLAGHPITDFSLINSGKPEAGTAVTQINVGTGLTGGGTGPTVGIGLSSNVLTSLTGSNGLQVTHSGGAYNVTVGPGVITLGNNYYAQLAAANTFAKAQTFKVGVTFASGQTFPGTATLAGNNTFAGTNTFSGVINADRQLYAEASEPGHYMIVGNNDASTPASGIYGAGSTYGVVGQSTGGTSDLATVGVYGSTANASKGQGIYGVNTSASDEGATVGTGAAIWADTSTANVALLATADSGTAGLFKNGSDSVTLAIENDVQDTGDAAYLLFAHSSFTGQYCQINIAGGMTCTGGFATTTDVDHNSRQVQTFANQSTENWFEDAGSAKLSGGAANVALDSTFLQTINSTVDYHVFLTPKGDCKGLYVANTRPDGFEVRELGGGESSVAFDYRIMAKRRGFEAARLTDVTNQRKLHPPIARSTGPFHRAPAPAPGSPPRPTPLPLVRPTPSTKPFDTRSESDSTTDANK